MADPKFIDGPPPSGVSAPKFIDGPAPEGVKPKTDVLKSGPSYGMDDDHILRAARYTDSQIKQIKSSSSYKPGAFAAMMTNPDSLTTKLRNAKLGPADYVLGALGQPTSGQLVQAFLNGVGTPASAALQDANHLLGAVGTRKPEDVLLQDAFRRVRLLDFKQNAVPGAYKNDKGQTPGLTKVADFVGQAAPLALLAGEQTATKGAGLLPKVVQGAKTGFKVGGAMGALTPVDDPQADFGKTKAFQVGGGMVGGGLLGGAAPIVTDKLIGPLATKINAAMSKTLPADAQAIQDLGDKFGVRTLAPDLTKSPTLNKTAVLMESVPGSGTVATRQAQQAEAKAAAQKLVDQYGIQGDTSEAIKSGLANKLASAKAAASAAYDKVGQLAQGKGDVPLDKTLQAIQQFKAQESSAVVPDQGLVGLLDKMETRIKAGQGGKFVPPQESPMFNKWSSGAPVVTASDAPGYEFKTGNPVVVQAFHGTDKAFDNFSKESVRSRFEYSFGHHFTTSPSEASVYADSIENAANGWNPTSSFSRPVTQGGNVRPSFVKMQNPLVYETPEIFKSQAPSITADMNRADIINKISEAKASGKPYDGVIIKRNIGDGYDYVNVISLDPKNIKSSTSGWWSTPTKEAPGVDISYTGVRGLRSDLGNMISDYYRGTNAATGSKGVQVLQGIKGAIEDDLSAFTSKNGPELAAAAKQADSLYKNGVVPFKDRLIASAVKTSEPDQIYKTMIQLGKGDRAQKFYNALDSNGQAAVRSQMVQNAMDAATVQDGVFSPAKFAQSLEKINDASGVFFKGSDKMELDGFTNLMRHIQRAGQIGENPPTGARAINALIAGEGLGAGYGVLTGHPAAAGPLVASSATARALNTLFQSARGKALLLAASDAKPGSTAMQKILEKVSATVGGEAGASTVPLKITPQLPAAAENQPNPDTLAQK